jgi:RNA polymerase sigma-70 factor, ECF subfamily
MSRPSPPLQRRRSRVTRVKAAVPRRVTDDRSRPGLMSAFEQVGSWAVPAPEVSTAGRAASVRYTPGDAADFDHLYQASFARVVRTLAGIVGSLAAAEDCAQDAFTRAYAAWPEWRGEVPAEAWIHRIAVNTAISHRRREQVRALPSLLWRLGLPHHEPDPADAAQSRAVLPELRRLPPKQAAAVILRFYHGYTNREIAAALGISERTVGQRIADASATLRTRLKDL